MDESPASSVQSVQKAISVLKAFSIQEPELGVNELSRRVGLHKSTVSRLLSTLEQASLVERNPVTEKFCLGVGLIPLAGLVISHADVRRASRVPLQWLADTTGETVNLAVLDGEQVINVEQIPSSRLVKNIGWVGRRSPLHCTSTGKVLLAHMSEARIDSVLAAPLASFTPSTVTDPAQLRDELTKIRDEGFAVGREELEEGLNAVAAPVRDHEGRVVAAVSVSGPSYRVSPEKFALLSGLVKEAANRIATQLGYAARQL